MAEDIPATPGWVESRLDQLWAEAGIGGNGAAAEARNAYVNCLATCTASRVDDAPQCQDVCRQELVEALRQQGFAAEALSALEQKLESLEAEINDSTLPSPSK